MNQAEEVELQQEEENEELEAIEDVEEAEQSEEAAEESTEGEADDSVVVSIGEEESPSSDEESKQAPAWVADLRRKHRELAKRNRELEALVSKPSESPKAVVVGNEPSLEDCDYDTDRFKREWRE